LNLLDNKLANHTVLAVLAHAAVIFVALVGGSGDIVLLIFWVSLEIPCLRVSEKGERMIW
jgi:hypothetical protein